MIKSSPKFIDPPQHIMEDTISHESSGNTMANTVYGMTIMLFVFIYATLVLILNSQDLIKKISFLDAVIGSEATQKNFAIIFCIFIVFLVMFILFSTYLRPPLIPIWLSSILYFICISIMCLAFTLSIFSGFQVFLQKNLASEILLKPTSKALIFLVVNLGLSIILLIVVYIFPTAVSAVAIFSFFCIMLCLSRMIFIDPKQRNAFIGQHFALSIFFMLLIYIFAKIIIYLTTQNSGFIEYKSSQPSEKINNFIADLQESTQNQLEPKQKNLQNTIDINKTKTNNYQTYVGLTDIASETQVLREKTYNYPMNLAIKSQGFQDIANTYSTSGKLTIDPNLYTKTNLTDLTNYLSNFTDNDLIVTYNQLFYDLQYTVNNFTKIPLNISIIKDVLTSKIPTYQYIIGTLGKYFEYLIAFIRLNPLYGVVGNIMFIDKDIIYSPYKIKAIIPLKLYNNMPFSEFLSQINSNDGFKIGRFLVSIYDYQHSINSAVKIAILSYKNLVYAVSFDHNNKLFSICNLTTKISYFITNYSSNNNYQLVQLVNNLPSTVYPPNGMSQPYIVIVDHLKFTIHFFSRLSNHIQSFNTNNGSMNLNNENKNEGYLSLTSSVNISNSAPYSIILNNLYNIPMTLYPQYVFNLPVVPIYGGFSIVGEGINYIMKFQL